MTPNLTLIVPCWKRPIGTKNLLMDVLRQTTNGWEALFIGDGCPDLDNTFNAPEVHIEISRAEARGNTIKKIQLDKNYGGSGYAAINLGIALAKNEFLIFAGNDDRISPNHFQNYLHPVLNNDLDLVLFDSIIKGIEKRISDLEFCKCGHSEIIVRSSIAKQVEPHGPVYGHDWIFITEILKKTEKIAKDTRSIATYNVMRLMNDPEQG
jgi:glycosyltransferase involved in cell wall biosynthesis